MKIQNLLINYTRQIIQQAESHTALGTAFSTIHAETCALYLCCKVTFASISPLNDNESVQQQATADLGLATSTVWAGPGVDRPVRTITEGPKSGYVQASDRAANIKCVME